MGGFHLRHERARSCGGWLSTRGRNAGVLRAALAALLSTSGVAHAQQTAAPLVPIVTPLKGDDAFAGKGLSVGAAFTPLRLSLTSGIFPYTSPTSDCEVNAEASGNSVKGFAVQRFSYLRLTPQLVLHGFSMAGCPVNAGMGGGLTYSIPLRKSLWLVSSAGIYAQPNPGGGAATFVTSAARVDVVKELAWGRTLSVGLGTRVNGGAFNALHFGGSF